MAATCYLCAIGHKTIPNTQAGEAVGVCKVCSVLACRGHGVRDANYPRWICVLCDLTVLTVAAVLQSGDEGAQQAALRDVSEEVIRTARSIRSARQYFEGRPMDSWSWIADAAGEYRQLPLSALDGATSRMWRGLTGDGQEMMRCALAIVDRLEVPDAELIEILRRVRAGVARRV
jgi:hypothetical protein